jgi:hypothetical protein
VLEHVGVKDGSRAAGDGSIDGGGFSVQVGFSLCVRYTVLSVFLGLIGGLTFDRTMEQGSFRSTRIRPLDR